MNVQATPGARAANVTLGDSGVRIALAERGAGRYVGSHTIRRGDEIDPTERMTVRARYGRQSIAANVAYPPDFQELAQDRHAPEIERFVLNARGGIEPGREVRFRLAGDAGGRAWVRIPGVADVQLQEQRPGVYVGDYTVRRRDDPRAFERAVATLQEDHRRSTARVTVRNDRDDDDDRRGRYGRYELPLEVTSHVNNAAVDADGQLTLRGRTAPHASVHVQVQPANPLTSLIGFQPPASQQWVRADANGHFAASLRTQGLPIPGTRYDVTLRASSGTQTAEESLTLYQRQG